MGNLDSKQADGAQVPRLFVSYRRADSYAIVGRLHDRLATDFGTDNIYLDYLDTPIGVDFVSHMTSEAQECDFLIAVVGPNWLGRSEGTGSSRIRHDDDPIRLEIATAIAESKPIIPVTADGGVMPNAADLPKEILGFATMNATTLSSGPDFDVHYSRIKDAVNYHTNGFEPPETAATDSSEIADLRDELHQRRLQINYLYAFDSVAEIYAKSRASSIQNKSMNWWKTKRRVEYLSTIEGFIGRVSSVVTIDAQTELSKWIEDLEGSDDMGADLDTPRREILRAGLDRYNISIFEILQGLGPSLVTPKVDAAVSLRISQALFGFRGPRTPFLFQVSPDLDNAEIIDELVHLRVVEAFFSETTNETFLIYTEKGKSLLSS